MKTREIFTRTNFYINKNLILLISLFTIYFSSYGQVDTELYIIVDSTSEVSIIESQDDSLTVEMYRFRYIGYDKYLQFSLDDEGRLKKQISMPGRPRNTKILDFIYEDISQDNKPILVRDIQMRNRITSAEIYRVKNFDEMVEFLNKITNIYIVNVDDYVYKDYYIAKKVKFKDNRGGL